MSRFSIFNSTFTVKPDVFLPQPNIPPHELNALWDLYSGTNGKHWDWSESPSSGAIWDFSGNPNPCSPRWQGLLCSLVPVHGYVNIIEVDLQQRNIRGRLPASFFNLTLLGDLSLASNKLFGTIPSTIGQLEVVVNMDFSYNRFTGSISPEIGNCAELTLVYFYRNFLNGSIPATIGNLKKLELLKLTENQLSGTLPTGLGQLVNMQILYLADNLFTGTIPAFLGNLVNCTGMQLYKNLLTGTIPPAVMNVRNITELSLETNYLSGTIPDVTGVESRMLLLALEQNHFTGTIPSSLSQLLQMQNLYLYDNTLTGNIPEALGSVTSLVSLQLDNNALSGSIPSSLGQLHNLNILTLSVNQLSGEIPGSFGQIVSLKSFEGANNYLISTLPATMGKLNNLETLYLYQNNLYGSVPIEFGGMSSLYGVYLYENMLSGTLPDTMSNLTDLSSLFLQDNKIQGSLDGVFNASKQLFVSTIQLGQNKLTGTIPADVFQLPLRTLVLVSNCLSVAFPSNICNCSELSTLSLDGLRTAASCQRDILPMVSTAYLLESDSHESLPQCLFYMPYLVTLHLSGNDLTGRLPGTANLSSSLLDVSISHNRLTGSIPRAFQQRLWVNMDLSYNKFDGILSSDFNSIPAEYPNWTESIKLSETIPALSLRNNRLSNTVPSILFGMQNISILTGNLFGCELSRQDLPAHDSGRSTYQCGSALFDISYYLWLSVCAAITIIAVMLYFFRSSIELQFKSIYDRISQAERWLTVDARYSNKEALRYYVHVNDVCDALGGVALWSTVFILCVLLPAYCALSSVYGTHTDQYAWTASAAFLSGYRALAVLLVFYMLFIVLVVILLRRSISTLSHFRIDRNMSVDDSVVTTTSKSASRVARWKKILVYAGFFMVNFMVVLGVNVAYVYVVIYERESVVAIAQITLSVFKLLWNSFGSVFLIRRTRQYLNNATDFEHKSKGASFFAIQLFVALFNFIAIPCLVVAVVSPNCFNDVLVNAEPVTTRYSYIECSVFSSHFGCRLYHPYTGTTSYTPPFTYSFQCSASIVTYYAPSFVYMALIVTFINPLVYAAFRYAYVHRKKGSWWAHLLEHYLPSVLRDPYINSTDDDAAPPYYPLKPIYDANLLLVNVLTYIAVLLTFGVVFPPVGAALLISIYAAIYTKRVHVGRFLSDAIDLEQHRYLHIVDEECHGVGSTTKLQKSAAMLVIFSCVFYTMFLFDTLGDSEGFLGAVWVIVVVPVLPPSFYFLCSKYARITDRRKHEDVILSPTGLELKDFTSGSGKQDRSTAAAAVGTVGTVAVIGVVHEEASEEDNRQLGIFTVNTLHAPADSV